MNEIITTSHSVGYVVADQPYCRLRVDLHWDATDALAVRLRIHSGHTVTVWHVSRDLLTDGLSNCAGEGDVIVRRHFADDDLTEIVLRSPAKEGAPERAALLLLDRIALLGFLSATWQYVPRDAEVVVSDEEIAQLCREVQP